MCPAGYEHGGNRLSAAMPTEHVKITKRVEIETMNRGVVPDAYSDFQLGSEVPQ